MARQPAPKIIVPWDPVELTQTEVSSIKAVWDGVANGQQQQIALQTIIHKLCRVDRTSFTVLPGSDDGRRASDFAEGKRWVANTIRNDIVNRQYPVNPRGAPPPMPGDSQPEKDET